MMAKTTTIKASSRCSVKVKDNYFTVEYTEERSIDENDDINKEKSKLWSDVNYEVDNQVDEIFNNFDVK